MIQKVLLPLLLAFITIALSAAENPDLNCKNIPEEMKTNARSVIRKSQKAFHVYGDKRASLKVHYALTVLKLNGITDSELYIPMNRFVSLGSFSGIIYDADGKIVEKIRKNDLSDNAMFSAGTLYSDMHYYYFNPKKSSVPFTVEYTFEIEYNGLMNYPKWQVYPTYNMAVEYSSFELVTPVSRSCRYYPINNAPECKTDTLANDLRYFWEVKNLQALQDEPLNPYLSNVSPGVLFAPGSFQMKRYAGNAENWQSFGHFIKGLNEENKNELTAETKAKIHAIAKKYPDLKERAKALYEFMQGKTRYVAIQEGIGYYQPIESEDVDRLCYGDCKALSNYMYVILREAGIKSYYAIINAGSHKNKIITDFPSNQFNHAILCIPFENDTTWLECTSQQNPYGYLGTFTDNRYALLITEEGGVLKKTPTYTETENITICNAIVEVNELGNCEASVSQKYQCLDYDYMTRILHSNADEQKKQIIENIDLPNFLLREYQLTENRSKTPSIEAHLTLAINDLGTLIGTRILFTPNLLNRRGNNLPDNERKTDIVLARSYSEYDTINYKLPQGYELKSTPDPIVIETKYGKYKNKVVKTADGIQYQRCLIVYEGTYPPEEYPAFRAYNEQLSKADNMKVILIKQN